jgi:hypothetical protein
METTEKPVAKPVIRPKTFQGFTHKDVMTMLSKLTDDNGQPIATRRALAAHLGVHESYISHIYSGRSELTDRILEQLNPPSGLIRKVIYIRKKGVINGKPKT